LAPSITKRLIGEFARRPRPVRAAPTGLEMLTAREREILGLMCRGHSNAEIAAGLVISEQTVKTHVGNVLAKLGLRPHPRGDPCLRGRPHPARHLVSAPCRGRGRLGREPLPGPWAARAAADQRTVVEESAAATLDPRSRPSAGSATVTMVASRDHHE
jgi:DNA-binding CsgD family transcriptional regulator